MGYLGKMMKPFHKGLQIQRIRVLLYVLISSVGGICLSLALKSQVEDLSSQFIPQQTKGQWTVPATSEALVSPKNISSLPAARKTPPTRTTPIPATIQAIALPAKGSPGIADNVAGGNLRLVIRLSQKRVTLYRGANALQSYPVAIGRAGWETPKGEFQVMRMIKNPTWINPLTDAVVPGGSPGNPLGKYWIAFWTDGRNWIGFHGTPNPTSVGTAASHGCIRMYNADVEELFHQVTPGTPVIVE